MKNLINVAIYIGKVRNEQLPVRKLIVLPRGLYASPAYCERRGVPTSPANLFEHDCIVLESQLNDGLWTFKMTGHGTRTVIPRMRTTDIIVAREMAVSGVGVALLTHAVCKAEVQSGRLVRLLPRWRLPPVVVGAMFLNGVIFPHTFVYRPAGRGHSFSGRVRLIAVQCRSARGERTDRASELIDE